MQPLYLHRLCLCKFRSLNRQVLTSGRVLGIVRKPLLLSHGATVEAVQMMIVCSIAMQLFGVPALYVGQADIL